MLKKKFIQKLTKIVGEENILTSTEDLTCYSYDAVNQKFLPEAVVFPEVPKRSLLSSYWPNQGQFPVIPREQGAVLPEVL